MTTIGNVIAGIMLANVIVTGCAMLAVMAFVVIKNARGQK